MEDKFTEYQLPTTAYTTFDAESLRTLIIDRLKEQQVFTDQVYAGSNLSSFIDIIAYSYHVLMFYLNRTASESMFSETTIYENINRIVKLLNYSPLGLQTSLLSFDAYASEDLAPGVYTLPRYTFVNANDITYSLANDISFTKNTTTSELIDTISENHLMYQGKWVEHTELTSLGQDFETITLLPSKKETKIDHFKIHVYIRSIETGIFHQYEEVSSLYLAGPTDKVFEKRLNENEAYEIKFGNNITGARPQSGDTIQIYYLESMGDDGQVGPGFLNDLKIVLYGTSKYTKVMEDIKPENVKFITFDNIATITFQNKDGSTKSQERESVEEIKRKAPLHLASQDRLVTLKEFETHITRNFGNMLTSSAVIDNDQFMDGHMRYLTEDIGIEYPNLESRVMYNHLKMSNSTHFNNVYVYGVPKMSKTVSTTVMTNFLTPSQKELILNDIEEKKMLSHEVVLMDPVYVAVNFGVASPAEVTTPALVSNTKLVITKPSRNLRDPSAIKQEIIDAIMSFFDNSVCKLGMTIELSQLGASLLLIDGVESIRTDRTDVNISLPGLSMAFWNPVYETDITTTNQNLKLPYYKFPYVFDPYNLYKKIEIES